MSAFDGVVLAGGRSERMGADKALISIGSRTFLQRALDALAGAREVIAVGPRRPTPSNVTWISEDPPGSGPAAALAAALPLLRSPMAVVLPVDLPGLDRDVVGRLVGAVRVDGAVLVDRAGHRQLPAGAYRTEALKRALDDDPRGASLRSVFDRLKLAEIEEPMAVDCDTPDDVETMRARLGDEERTNS